MLGDVELRERPQFWTRLCLEASKLQEMLPECIKVNDPRERLPNVHFRRDRATRYPIVTIVVTEDADDLGRLVLLVDTKRRRSERDVTFDRRAMLVLLDSETQMFSLHTDQGVITEPGLAEFFWRSANDTFSALLES